MDQLIAAFPQQLQEAIQIGQQATLTDYDKAITNILVTGLGGSGMGANIVIDYTANELTIPMAVNKDYNLPAYVNENTLLIASSYSGNTEETIAALQEGIQRKAKIVCVTSGGKMQKIAEEHKLDIILLPSNHPSPRACLGYSFVQQLFILQHFGFIKDTFIQEIEGAIEILKQEEDNIREITAQWGKELYDKIPIIYAPDKYGSIAIRWRQQFNENGKILAWHHIIPEMNHNELVGWRTKDDRFAPIFFHAEDVNERTKVRININKTIISSYTTSIFDVMAKGNSHLTRMLYITYFGDWLSWFISKERNMDAIEVKVIDYLKGELAKV